MIQNSKIKSFFLNIIFIFFLFIFSISLNISHADLTSNLYSWSANDFFNNWRNWSNINNATWNNTNTYSEVNLWNNTTSNTISLTNFNISSAWIPDWSIINWIQVSVERFWSHWAIVDNLIQLTKNWTTWVWNNLASWNSQTNKWITTYWWTNNLWWTTWTKSELESNNFWVLINYTKWGWWNRYVRLYRVFLVIDYTLPTQSVTPGWVNESVSLWFKTNVWTSTTTNWSAMNTWFDQSWNSNNASAWVSPTYLNNNTDNLNFYPVVNFNWNQYLNWLNNGWNSDSYFMVIIPNNTVDWTLTWQVPFWFDCDSWTLNTWTCWLPFAWLTLWAFTVAINDEVITHAIWSSTSWRSSNIWNNVYSSWKPMLLSVNWNSSWNWTDIYEKWVKIDNYSVNNYQVLSNANFSIGRSLDPNNIFPYNGRVVEIINFQNKLSSSDIQKVESYLAIKYGITLNNWNTNYLNSNWDIIFNPSTSWWYNFNIFAIWRDDLSWLWQIKSKSSNSTWIVTIEAVWQWDNLNPSFTDMDDNEFVFVWNNNWSNTWTQIWSPSWYSILDRKWRLTEVWDIWNINIDFDVSNSDFNIPNLLSWTDYYFVYDSNNTWILTDETPIPLTNISWNIWRITWDIPHQNVIFTIATLDWANNIPTDIILSNNSINENVSVWTLIWTLSTVDLDVWDTHTYSLVSWLWDTDNIYFSIVWNNLYIQKSPDYEIKNIYNIRIQTDDWNWWQFQKQLQINILNLPEAINSIVDFEDWLWKYVVTSWNWIRASNSVYEWTYSFESDNWWIPNTQSCFEVTNTFAWEGTIDFKYRVSSQSWWDFLRFFINNVEQQSWSWDIPWSTFTKTDVTAWTHVYKWCYIKDWATNSLLDRAFIDYITFFDTNADNNPPVITWTNFLDWVLLPWWNHSIVIDYYDIWSWIDVNSAVLELYKWNWSSWWTNIFNTWINPSYNVTVNSATYSTNNLDYGRYKYFFEIKDVYWNSDDIEVEFYIDRPELIINSWEFNSYLWNNFWLGDDIVVTVRTIWAWFNVELIKESDLIDALWNIIINWDWQYWVWYDTNPYWNLNNFSNNTIIWTQAQNINTSWNLNEYNFIFKIWTLVDEEQAAGEYLMNIWFNVILNY